MSVKRKRVVLTVKEKVEIVERLNQGVSGTLLAQLYGVGTSTISDIKKKRDSIMEIGSLLDSQDKRKTLKSAENKELESEVFAWFIQKRSQGEPVSGPLICEKALEVNAQLNGDTEFKASTGWLTRFKSRHGICREDISGDKHLPVDQSVAESFQKMIEGCSKSAEMVCHVETGFNWKSLPSRSLASKHEVARYKRLSSPSTSTSTSSAYLPVEANTSKLSSSSTSTRGSTRGRSTSSTYIPVVTVTTNALPKVEASSASSSVAQGQLPVPLSLSVANSQATIVNQQGCPGLPQITEISWGTAVPELPTTAANWVTDYILPTTDEVIQPRTRDIGVQVELITTETKNVIHNSDWEHSLQPSQTSRKTYDSTSSQYDRVDDPPPLEPLRSRSTSSREPIEQGISSAKSCGKTGRVFLVFEAMLLQLFTFCRMCFAGCSASVSSSCISVVVVQTRCNNGHTFKWESQPPKKSLGFIQLLQKEVNRLRSEYHPSRQQRPNIKKRLKCESEFIDVLELLALPKPLTCSSSVRDDRYVDS